MSDDESSGPASPAAFAPVLQEEGDICGDGTITKEILTTGSGTKPPTGAEVEVHYTGTLLDGTKFDSSVDRGDKFKFKLGRGNVIKGWDEGVSTMKKGEKAKFTIVASKAYGSQGSPPKIPPNSTLVFEIELFDWSNTEDVSEKRDKSFLKEILKAGAGYQTPKDFSTVKAHYTLSLLDGTVVATTRGDNAEARIISIDDGENLPVVEAAVKHMKRGEHAKFTIQPQHAFGTAGDAALGVPANATVLLDIELFDFTSEKEAYDLEGDDKLQAADRWREAGNDYFKKSDIPRALRRYQKSLTYAESEFGLNDEQKKSASAKKLLAHLNIAAAHLKALHYKEARESSTKALEIDGANPKGLFRRGTALMELGEWDDARRDLQRAIEVEPNNDAAVKALATLKHRIAKQAESDRKRYRGMFDRLSKSDGPKDTPVPAETDKKG